ncbi:MAG: hypothetical protein ABII01_02865 [Candidatus Woesearchaeota archaeon]
MISDYFSIKNIVIFCIVLLIILTACTTLDLTEITSKKDCESLGQKYYWDNISIGISTRCGIMACNNPDAQYSDVCSQIQSCNWIKDYNMCCKDNEEVTIGRAGIPICCAKNGFCD